MNARVLIQRLCLSLLLVTVLVATAHGAICLGPEEQCPASVGATDLATICRGDGVTLDLVTVDPSLNQVMVLYNDGKGDFESAVTYPVGKNPIGVATGDLNGDGCADIAVINKDSFDVSILMGTTKGFRSPIQYALDGEPRDILVADMDNDKDLDLAVMKSGDIERVAIMYNSGNGIFAAPVPYGAGVLLQTVVATDIDRDTDLDLVVTDRGTASIWILRNLGSTFAPQETYSVGKGPYGIAPADFDGDGYIDLAVTLEDADRVAILLNKGNGGFSLPQSFLVGSHPHGIEAEDLDGDRRPDLLVANHESDNLTVHRNIGGGNFEPGVAYSTGKGPERPICGDLDRRGGEDVVIVNAHDRVLSCLMSCTRAPAIASARSPQGFQLQPNPMREDGIIQWDLADRGPVDVRLYDATGRLVRAVMVGSQGTLAWKHLAGGSLPDGVYFVRISGPDGEATQRVVLAR